MPTINELRATYHHGEASRDRACAWLWLVLAFVYLAGASLLTRVCGIGAFLAGLIAVSYRRQAHHHELLADWYLGRDHLNSKE